jgi:TRAP-type C4-dicarboxylate transport system permease small subunit
MQPSKSSNGPATATPRGVAAAYIRLIDRLSVTTAVIAAGLLISGVVVVCQMIFVRYILNQSTVWQTEYTIYSITGAMMLGAPYVLLTKGHVAVTALPDYLGGLARTIMLTIGRLVGLGFCLALTYAAWFYVYEAWHLGWGTGTVWNPPLWIPIFPMAIAATLLCLQYIAEFLRGAP